MEFLREATLPPLAADEELKIARRAKRGDKRAQDLLVRSNLPLAHKLVSKYAKIGSPLYDDLMGAAMLGYAKAITMFQPARKYRFATYALWWSRAFIMRALSENKEVVVPTRKVIAGVKPFERADVDLNRIEDDDALFPDTTTRQRWARNVIEKAKGRVRSKRRTLVNMIVEHRLLQHPDDAATLSDLGGKVGITRERARQIEEQVKSAIRRAARRVA